jgi:hypothetical protein
LEEESVANVKIYNLSVEVFAVEGMVGAPLFRFKEIEGLWCIGNIEKLVLFRSKEYIVRSITFLCFVNNFPPIYL